MLNDEPAPIGHQIASGYHGTVVQPQNREVEACQNLWNREIKVGSFDDLIYRQLENAKKQGRKKVTVLDIGSGQGNLFQDYLSEAKAGTKSRGFLAQNKDISIDMVGITDAKTVDELLTEQEITPNNDTPLSLDNSQVKARNIKYTLSYQQRIEDVLKAQQIDGIDLCVSTVALTYLGPNVFENTLQDVVKNLHSGGQMVAYDYSGITAGIVQPDAMFLSLDIRDIPDVKTTSSLKATLHESGIRFARRKVDIQQEEDNLVKAEALMVKLGVVEQASIEERRKKFLSDLDVRKDRATALVIRAGYLLSDEKELITRHILKLRQIKKQQLTSLFETHKNQIEGDFKEGTIYFKKN